ncbi:hypothetical protein N0B31_09715 [Salinirubellus salinus]|uniref:Uncharacterized protein n=1 Tax=Salinirubellus salinus TaxID=1364945 RepID=A0A9E7UA20_9EURY|nr:hypothetical protein [Salinirubellus salinus]UWM56551.1 hypothetical protein N0B31_09715 [Salinirubellus salinus]
MRAEHHRDTAIEALADRDYRAAGDAYTRAGRAALADPRGADGPDPFAPDEKGWVGRGLQYLCVAAVAYRVAGLDSRATYRAVEGAAAARDLRTVWAEPVQRACLTEFVGDFHVAGGLGGASDVYADAAERYEAAAPDDPMTWATTPLFEAANTVIQQVARGPANGEIAVQWDDLHGADPNDPGPYLAHRATYKARRFSSLVATVVDEGSLAAPRGTTEYDNATYRCPSCESTDVNWTGGSVLCLRCSARVAER